MKNINGKKLIQLFVIVSFLAFMGLDVFHNLKYKIINPIVSFFQSDYTYVNKYYIKVPQEWFQLSERKGELTFLGPVWNKKDKMSVIQLFTDDESIVDNYLYFDPNYCTDLDTVMEIENNVYLYTNDSIEESLTDTTPVPSRGQLILCKNKNGQGYVSFENIALKSNILVRLYDHEYKTKYIDLFKNIDFILIDTESSHQ